MEIDWSKAPADATHWEPASLSLIASWMKLSDGRWFYWPTHDLGIPKCWGVVGGDIPDSRVERMIPRPVEAVAEWDGEGLPPVGARVLLDDSQHTVFDDYREMIGVPVTVTAAFESPTGIDMIACALPDGLCGCFRADMARPIRTPEQIAADESLAEIERLYAEGGPAAVFDAGYRKAEAAGAAPELLDALEGLLDFIEIDKLPMDALALKIARAAVTKARGA